MKIFKYSSTRVLNEVYNDKEFIRYLKNYLKNKFPQLQNDVEDAINNTWIKLKKGFDSGRLSLKQETKRNMISYFRIASVSVCRDMLKSSWEKGIRNKSLVTDEGFEGGSFKGIDISQEDAATRGWGSFPSDLDDRIFLNQTNEMLNSEDDDLDKFNKKNIRDIINQMGGMNELNTKSHLAATFTDAAKEEMKQKGIDYDEEMSRIKDNPTPNNLAYGKSLSEQLKTLINTLNKRHTRGQEKLNEWYNKTKSSNNSSLLLKLIKMANKLDYLGLKKEADLTDKLIKNISNF
jgi:hypothetical protein